MSGRWSCRALLASVAIALALAGCMPGDDAANERKPEPLKALTPTEQSLERAVAWLLDQQASDGGWHSATYGQLRGGAANTALVVYALSHLPAEKRARIRDRIDRALTFVMTNIDKGGFVRCPDGSSDYPTYATSLLLTALARMDDQRWSSERQRMRTYLEQSQRSFPFRRFHVADQRDAGGWDKDSTNTSMTSYALEALNATGGVDEKVLHPALGFLYLCQNPILLSEDEASRDGGFFFKPKAEHELNKAGWYTFASTKFGRSYGPPTADGLVALILCGVPEADKRRAAALDWLKRHPDVSPVPGPRDGDPGMPDIDGNQYADGLTFYYAAALGRAIRYCADSGLETHRTAMHTMLVREQRSDGSWRNASTFMREDDPLIATALATAALAMTLDVK